MIILKYLLSLNRYSRNGKKNNQPKGIILHHCENENYGALETRNYFDNLKVGKNAVYYSTHYIVGFEGEIVYCVPEDEVAYHRGNCEESRGYISISYCAKDKAVKPETNSLNSLKALVRDIVRRYGFNINTDFLRHFDVSGISCPLYYSQNNDKWEELKAEIEAELEITEVLASQSDMIAKKLSEILMVEEGYLKNILEEKAIMDIKTIAKISHHLLKTNDSNQYKK